MDRKERGRRSSSKGLVNLYQVGNALAGNPYNADATTGLSTGASPDTFESQQAVVPAGYTNAIHIEDNVSPSNGVRFYEDLSSILVDGKRYTFEFWWRHVGTGVNWQAYLSSTNVANSGDDKTSFGSVSDSDTTYEMLRVKRIFSSAEPFLVFREQGAASDGGIYITGLRIVG